MMDDRRLTVAVWVLELAVFAVLFVFVASGAAPGLEQNHADEDVPWGHPGWYLEASVVMCALALSVIPVLRLIGAVRMPWWFNCVLALDVYIYVISLCCGLYLNPETMDWWGFFGHVLSSMSVGAIVFLALCLVQKYSPSFVNLGSMAAIHCYTLMISLAFGGIWEVMEGYVDVLVGDHVMVYGNFDTLDDLRADLLGCVIMVVLLGYFLRGKTAEEIASTTEFHRPKALDRYDRFY